MGVKTIEGNTSASKGLIANGGGVAAKEYANTYSKIAVIFRPPYKDEEEAKKVVKVARSYIGYLEKKTNAKLNDFTANAGYNNFNMFAPHAKSATGCSVYVNGVAWCDIFVDDMFIRAYGASRAKYLLGGYSVYTPDSANLLSKIAKKVSPAEARFGDVIFFKNSTRICHTGIVTNGYEETPATNKFTYSQEQFVSDVCKALGVKSADAAFNKTITLSAKKNSNHILVLYLQSRLKDLGYYTGTPDREFGNLTTKAVNAYQTKVLKYKTTDGEVTKKGKMWKSLLGIK